MRVQKQFLHLHLLRTSLQKISQLVCNIRAQDLLVSYHVHAMLTILQEMCDVHLQERLDFYGPWLLHPDVF